MYEDHFGLTGRPFQLTPDPQFWFETATHRKAMAYLGYGLAQGEGFIVITGDIGAGKTTLLGHLLGTLDPQRVNAIKLVSTAIEAADLLRIVATEFGVDPAGKEKGELLLAIERGLHAVARTGRRTLLVVDEAQALPTSALEELRMLSNFQAGGHALLQILLLGQPEFRDQLHGAERLEQLRQRVIAIHHLDPMEPGEVASYVAHRLSLVGWQGRPDFADDAFLALYQGSGGVPRRLNLLAGRVMLHAAVEGIELIDGRVVRAVLRDLHADLPTQRAEPTAAAAVAAPAPAPATPPAQSAPQPDAAAIDDARPIDTASDPSRSFVPRTSKWLDLVPTDIDLDPAGPAPTAPAATDTAPFTPGVTDTASAGDRLAALEARIDEQDAALRRVLTLLVDWVEGDADKPAAALSDYVPIRGHAA